MTLIRNAITLKEIHYTKKKNVV